MLAASRSVYDFAVNLVCLRYTSTTNNSENLMREIYSHNLLRHAYSNVTTATFCSDS